MARPRAWPRARACDAFHGDLAASHAGGIKRKRAIAPCKRKNDPCGRSSTLADKRQRAGTRGRRGTAPGAGSRASAGKIMPSAGSSTMPANPYRGHGSIFAFYSPVVPGFLAAGLLVAAARCAAPSSILDTNIPKEWKGKKS
nr:hypothetical protein [Candidatus Sigynarchaeum springense]